MITYQERNMVLFLAQLCMFITSKKMLENSISYQKIFFNTSLIVSQKHMCIYIVVLLVLNFKNASQLYEHPIYIKNANKTKNQKKVVRNILLLLGDSKVSNIIMWRHDFGKTSCI